MNRRQYWQQRRDEDDIVWLRLATPWLNGAALAELDQRLTALSTADALRGVVFGGSAGDFCCGTELDWLYALAASEAPLPELEAAQAVLEAVERLSCPTVAAIDGACLGGGLELALACDYRLASDDPSTRLGMPEVRLGLHPALGASLRLPRLIGAGQALPLLLEAEPIDSAAARRNGLIDYRIPRRQLHNAARELILQAPSRQALNLPAQFSNLALLRAPLARRLRAGAAAHCQPEHQPAPFALIDLWEHQTGDRATALRAEAESFTRLLLSDNAHNLWRTEQLRQRLRQLPQAQGAEPVRHVHIIGCGGMGGAVAAWCALQGLKVSLQDSAPRHIAAVLRRARQLYLQRQTPPALLAAALQRLQPDPRGDAIGHADLVLETLPETLAVKQEVLRTLEPRLKPTAAIASNSAGIPLEALAASLADPSRLVGIHFFNPPARQPLVEVICSSHSSQRARARALGFVAAMDHCALPVSSSPGYLVNRVLHAYLEEAMLLFDEGTAATTVDATALRFGMPLAPLELADRIGLDKCLAQAEALAAHRGGEVPAVLATQVAAGRLGRRNARGFYDYRHDRPVKLAPDPDHASLDEIGDRILYRLLNEAVACLRERVVADADLIDAGLILSGGFPAFRGGPLHYVRSRGVEASRHRLSELAGYYGERFEPDPGWEELAALGDPGAPGS